MNAPRAIAIAAVLGFVVLYLRSPRDPGPALRYLRWLVLIAASTVVLAPFAWLLAAVFKDKSVLNEHVFLPPPSEWWRTLNFDNFRRLFQGEDTIRGKVFFWRYLLNSLFLASTVTVVQLVLCSAAGYALAKYEFWGKRALTLFTLGSMMVPSVLLFAPLYEMVVDLGLVNTYQGVVLPAAVSAYGIFLFRQAIFSVPSEMLDAGRIDGSSEIGIYLRLVMPLVRPMSAAFCLIAFLTQWNAFFQPSIFLQSQDMLTLPVVLNLYLGLYQNDYGVFLAGTAVAIVPPAVLFFALEREFVGGLTAGAVRG